MPKKKMVHKKTGKTMKKKKKPSTTPRKARYTA